MYSLVASFRFVYLSLVYSAVTGLSFRGFFPRTPRVTSTPTLSLFLFLFLIFPIKHRVLVVVIYKEGKGWAEDCLPAVHRFIHVSIYQIDTAGCCALEQYVERRKSCFY